jgi:hypothetical protein
MFVTLPNPHLGAPACPSTPKVLQARECAPTSYSFVVFTLDLHLNLSRSLGARHLTFKGQIALIQPEFVYHVCIKVGSMDTK